MDPQAFTKLIRASKAAGPDINIIKRNREEVYRISKLLPEIEGYKLLAMYDESVKASYEAYGKVHHELNN